MTASRPTQEDPIENNGLTSRGVLGAKEFQEVLDCLTDHADRIDSSAAALVEQGTADATLQANIDALTTASAAARAALQSALQTNIDDEEAARIAADNALQASVDANAAAIAALDAARQAALAAAVANLQSQHDALNTIVTAALDSPDTALDQFSEIIAKFATITSSIDGLTIASISGLQTALDDEAAARVAGISAEQAARTAGDNAEATARSTAVSGLQSQLDGLGGSLNSESEVRESKDMDFSVSRPNRFRNNGTGLLAASRANLWSASSSVFDTNWAIDPEYGALWNGTNGTTGPIEAGRFYHNSSSSSGSNPAIDAVAQAFIDQIEVIGMGASVSWRYRASFAVLEYSLGTGTAGSNVSGNFSKFVAFDRGVNSNGRSTYAAWIQPVGGDAMLRSTSLNARGEPGIEIWVDGVQSAPSTSTVIVENRVAHVCVVNRADIGAGYSSDGLRVFSDSSNPDIKLRMALPALLTGALRVSPEMHCGPIRSDLFVAA